MSFTPGTYNVGAPSKNTIISADNIDAVKDQYFKKTEAFNPDLHAWHTTKESKQRWSHTYSSLDDASYWLWWIKRIPELEARIRALEACCAALS